MNKLALGTAQFGLDYGVTNFSGKVGEDEVKSILDVSCARGIAIIDTAIAYGNSQKVLGEADISRFNVVSKLPSLNKLLIRDVAEHIELFVNDILSELKLNSLYGLLLHDENDVKSEFGAIVFRKLQELQRRGLVQKVGASFYDFELMDYTLKQFDIQVVQVPFNVFDQRILNHKYSRVLFENNIEVHCRSLFLQGALLHNETPMCLIKYKKYFDKFRSFCLNHGLTQLQACLKFGLQTQLISHMIVGVTTKKELEEILGSLGELSFVENYVIDFSSLNSGLPKLTNPSLWG